MRKVSVLERDEAHAIEPAASSHVRLSDEARAARRERPSDRDRARSRRARAVRAQTVNMNRLSKRELERGRALYPVEEHDGGSRPKTRAECDDVERPCCFVSCRHNLYLDVSPTGAIKLNFPDLEPGDVAPDASCALDIAAHGGLTLEEVGRLTNITRERVRQMQDEALARLLERAGSALREQYSSEEDRRRRRLPLLSSSCDEDEEQREDEEDAGARDEIDPEQFASAELDDD